jgi:hypothetical protein
LNWEDAAGSSVNSPKPLKFGSASSLSMDAEMANLDKVKTLLESGG